MRWIILSLATLGLLLTPAGLAQQDTQMNNETEITILAPEECDDEDGLLNGDGNDTDQQNQDQQNQDDQNQTTDERCLEVENGSIGDIEQGDDVTVTFQNEDDVSHTLHVAEMNDTMNGQTDQNNQTDDQNQNGETDPADAIASSDPTDMGEETNFTFTAPVAGDELYFWGENYEEDGMWLTADSDAERQPVPGEPEREPGEGEPQPDTDRDDTPLPALAAVAAVGLAAAARARR